MNQQAIVIRKRKITLAANTPVFISGLDFDAGDNPTYASGSKVSQFGRKGVFLSSVLGASTARNVYLGIGTLNSATTSDYTQALFNEDYTGVKLESGFERSTELMVSEHNEVTIMADIACDVIVWEWA